MTWDTEEKYQDIRFIVNRDNENSDSSFTALYNGNAVNCQYAADCNGQLVSLIIMLFLDIIMLNQDFIPQQWKPNDTVTATFTDGGYNE